MIGLYIWMLIAAPHGISTTIITAVSVCCVLGIHEISKSWHIMVLSLSWCIFTTPKRHNVLTSGQRTLTKRRISCHAVIDDWMIPLLRTPQQRLSVLCNGPDNPPKLPLHVGDLDPRRVSLPKSWRTSSIIETYSTRNRLWVLRSMSTWSPSNASPDSSTD